MARFILWLLLPFLLISCEKQSDSQYPIQLEEIIDLFFVENLNDSLLHMEIPASDQLPENIRHVHNIIKAAALSESGRADSAQIILENVNPEVLQPRDLYYYHGTMALTQFRLNDIEQALQTVSVVENSEVHDGW